MEPFEELIAMEEGSNDGNNCFDDVQNEFTEIVEVEEIPCFYRLDTSCHRLINSKYPFDLFFNSKRKIRVRRTRVSKNVRGQWL